MDDSKNELDKIDEVMLPGFRFHPTDEELVGFYLKRKIQQRTLPIELIKQLDIYKYDPWDLPRSKCIGLKKSLVFYRGRAAKGIKTDWMMHEFRLPSYTDSNALKKANDKSHPATDAWAICRIFKKTNSMAQRALSHSWVSPPLPEVLGSDILNYGTHCTQFISENISCTTEAGSSIQISHSNDLQQSSAASFSPMDVLSYQSINPVICKQSLPSISNGDLPAGFMFAPIDNQTGPVKSTVDAASLLANLSPSLLGDISKVSESFDFAGVQQHFNGFSFALPHELPGSINYVEEKTCSRKNPGISHTNNHGGAVRSVTFPFNLPLEMPDAWKPTLPWDSPPCPSEMSTSHSTNKCYT
ncbi:hypothetical protein Scep_017375 [Stephania cephalantha]|uniref:NAC domain-containing protein n=1 Tax=Stephania cephalantha TaxID=152367 RepID=A0AAP0IR97_9MAGN